ncbi:hypothetical protein PMN64_16290 [Bradyrhizobium sp. UFLA01-814]|uniref:hypothetical protein n=1 Tax=Bradyrhizobium sp. UFLA01-814 TaxID=3023480 RepID=UPI00398B47FA
MFQRPERPDVVAVSSARRRPRMSLRRLIEGLGPYPSLLLLALPIATVEPLKLAAVALAGKGHWITGTAMIAACYAFSLLIVERLFVIVKPKLLSISWFARLWEGFISVRVRARLWRVLKHCIGLRPDRGSSAPSPRPWHTEPFSDRRYPRR